MKLLTVFLLISLATLALMAETIVPPGPVQGTWTQSGSPYRVTGNLSVAAGSSLLLEAGTEVIFAGTFRIDVSGQLLASGIEAAPVTFTAQDTLNGWSGIRFLNTGVPASGFTSTQFSYGKAMWGSGGADPLNYGGAIWASNAGTLGFQGCSFIHCFSSQDGSAVYAKDGTNIVMQGCTVKSCESGFFGGVFVKNGTADISGCSFESNAAVTFGAAIYLYECGSASITSCTIAGNTAGAVAGIYCYDSPLVIRNSLLANNDTTMGLGGGIGAIFGSLSAINCTFAQNSSPQGGAAIWLNSLGTPAQLANCLFWGNAPVAITTTSCSYNLSHCSTQTQDGDATNIWGDPQFENEAEGDFSLSATSPCIDAGNPDLSGLNLPPSDLAGMDRVVDGNGDGTPRIDIGCFEWQIPVVNGTLAGVVTDPEADPIGGATVTVDGQTVVTDAAGEFSLELLAGIYSLSCSAPDFETQVLENLTIIAGQTTNVSIELVPIVANPQDTAPAPFGLRVSPNPFVGSAEINWDMKHAAKLEIFNSRGQLVRSQLLDNANSQGSWFWDGKDDRRQDLTTGIYLIRLSTREKSYNSKVLLRK
jgi:hypothetical protein